MQPVKLRDALWTCHVQVMDLPKTRVQWPPREQISPKLSGLDAVAFEDTTGKWSLRNHQLQPGLTAG